MTARQRIVTALLIGAVGLAFADASVVALALPDLYGEFNTSIVGVSWVLTTYALVVAVVSVPVALLHRRVRPLSLVVLGTAMFAAASLVAGFANSLALLLTARAVQGVGATLLLAGSLPVLGAIVPPDPDGAAGRGGGGRWPAPSAWRSVRRSAACSPSCSRGGRSSSCRRRSLPGRWSSRWSPPPAPCAARATSTASPAPGAAT